MMVSEGSVAKQETERGRMIHVLGRSEKARVVRNQLT